MLASISKCACAPVCVVCESGNIVARCLCGDIQTQACCSDISTLSNPVILLKYTKRTVVFPVAFILHFTKSIPYKVELKVVILLWKVAKQM